MREPRMYITVICDLSQEDIRSCRHKRLYTLPFVLTLLYKQTRALYGWYRQKSFEIFSHFFIPRRLRSRSKLLESHPVLPLYSTECQYCVVTYFHRLFITFTKGSNTKYIIYVSPTEGNQPPWSYLINYHFIRLSSRRKFRSIINDINENCCESNVYISTFNNRKS